MMAESKTFPMLRWANVAAFLITIVVNALAGSTSLLNNKTTADVSDQFISLVTPAGYVFSIWGIIYTLLLIFIIYQALPAQKDKEFQKEVGILFILSDAFNIIWLFLWQYEYITLSVLLMFTLLLTLIMIYLRLNIGKSHVKLGERLSVHLPFSVYLGWITIATIADVAAALVSINWDGFGLSAVTWFMVVVFVALAITLLVLFTRMDIAYSLVIIWALVGIAVKRFDNPSVVMTSEIIALIIAIAAALSIIIFRSRRS
jgi:benzodiazapine receptor